MTDPHGWWGYRPGIMTVGAVKPGHAPDGETRKRYTAAAKKYAKCEKCPWPDGCHYPRCAGPESGSQKWDREKARRLWDEGISQRKIAAYCGVSPSTITRWAKQQKLTRAPRENPCDRCTYAKAACTAGHYICPDKLKYEEWRKRHG